MEVLSNPAFLTTTQPASCSSFFDPIGGNKLLALEQDFVPVRNQSAALDAQAQFDRNFQFMISDPTFSNTVPRETVGTAVKVTESWFVELNRRAPKANPTIKHGEKGGLELRWEEPVGRARLWQPINQEGIRPDTRLLKLSATVDLIGGSPTSIKWIAILEESNGDLQFHSKFKLSTIRLKSGVIVAGEAAEVRLEPHRCYRFCIQFSEEPKHLTIQSVELQATEIVPPKSSAVRREFNDSALLIKQLKCTLDFDSEFVDHDAIERAVRTLSERSDLDSLLRLLDHVGGISAPVPRVHPLRSYVIQYYALTMLGMNASETAYAHFKALLDTPLLADAFADGEIRTLRKLLARASLRSGRTSEAIDIHRELIREDPLDWEPYFQLGLLHSASNEQARRLFHNAAETLCKEMPSVMLCAIAEAYINEGLPQEGLGRALTRLVAVQREIEEPRFDDKELYLTSANAWLVIGERKLWLANIQRYFGEFALLGPQIKLDNIGGNILDMCQASTEQTRSGPLVTVIMTSFNAADTIEYAVRSVLNQTHGNLRLVIVDDCSDDGSRDVITRIASEDHRVEVLFNDRNMGTYCSKNRALRQFESDFFTFHDSDDWMHPSRLTEHLAATRDAVRVTTSMWVRVDEKGRLFARTAGGYLHENPASTFFGADVLDTVGFFDSVRTGADSEFTWRTRRMLGTKAVQRIRKPLALGLNRLGSLTRSGPAAFDEFRYSPVRQKYWEAWTAWHNCAVLNNEPAKLFLPFPMDERRFEAPAEILPNPTTID